MQIKVSKQRLARIATLYLLIFVIAGGWYTAYQASQGAYQQWVTTDEGIIETKFIYEDKPHFRMNDKSVYVSKEIYDRYEKGQRVSLGHNKDTLSDFRILHVIISIVISLIVACYLTIRWLDWIYNHSDSETFIEYLQG